MSETLLRLKNVLDSEIQPRAEAIDQNPEAARAALDALGRSALLALARPTAFGGPALNNADYLRSQAMIARASGVLAFLQTQHQSAVRTIAAGDNDTLQSAALPAMANTRRMGIGYSQLRRPGPPMVRVRPRGTSFIFDGVVPWVTGAGYFQEVLLAGRLPDRRIVFGVVPLEAGPTVTLGPAMRLASMEVTHTVEMKIHAHEVGPEHVARVVEPDWMDSRDAMTVASKAFFALGCGRAALDGLESLAFDRGEDHLAEIAAAWSREHASLEETLLRMALAEGSDVDEEARARAAAIVFAVRAAHAYVAASGGGANLVSHPAQRIYREALAFSVLGQTSAVRRATVEAWG